MARRPASRHARPRGRAGLEAAYADLQVDLARIRWARYDEQLQVVQMTAQVEGLASHVSRLTSELSEVRRELQAARTSPPQRDPAIEVLAAQAAELRATVATQQAMLADLTARFTDVLMRLEAAQSAAAAAAVPVPAPAPAAEPVASPVVVDLADAQQGQPELASVGPSRSATPRAAFDAAFDDETVRRLRLIREVYGS